MSDMDIKDLAGLSGPLTRLIEVISKGVGAVSASYLTRKNAESKALEIRLIADALNDVANRHKLPVIYKDGAIEIWQKPEDHTLILDAKPVDDRSDKRIECQSRKEQANIENVTSVAAIELAYTLRPRKTEVAAVESCIAASNRSAYLRW